MTKPENNGTTDFTLNLLQETAETGRQFPFHPKAMHPQMESLISLPGTDIPVMSIAFCGFTQLELMDEVPDDLADAQQLSRYAFKSAGVVNISQQCLSGSLSSLKEAQLSPEAADELQKFLAHYSLLVLHIQSPLVIKLDPIPVQETSYDSVKWFTYAVSLIASVSMEEWDKMFDLKKKELVWAAKVKIRDQMAAQLVMDQAMNIIRG